MRAMILWNVDSDEVLRASEEFTEVVGYSPGELGAGSFEEWVHPDDYWPTVQRMAADGVGRARARHRTKADGWVEVEWEIRRTEGATVALGRHVESQVDLNRPTARPALPFAATRAESMDRMARIVEAKNPGLRCSILLVDPTGEYVTVGAGPSLPKPYNDAVEGLRIGPAVGSCGTAAFWNIPVVVEDIQADPLWAELRDAAEIAGVRACWSQPIVSSEGSVLGAMALYADEPGLPTRAQMDGLEIAAHMVGLAVERHRLEERLREVTKMDAVGRLAGGVAHDFNNLMMVVLGQVDLLGERADHPPDPTALEAISRAAGQATAITSQLLAFGRRQVRRPERVELGSAVRDVIGVLDPLLGDDVTVSVSADPSTHPVTIDRTQFGQVIMNLALNGKDAMPSGGRILVEVRPATDLEVTMVAAGAEPAPYMAVTVEDTGSGMTQETLERAFEPFFTTKAPAGGTGLGLATVYGLTKQNGGFVAIESESGKGTKVTLLFPSESAGEDPAAASAVGDSATAGEEVLADTRS